MRGRDRRRAAVGRDDQGAVRVDHARRLLPSGTSLSSIATSSGFADQSHLNRHFKRQYGFTPGVFRRLLLPA